MQIERIKNRQKCSKTLWSNQWFSCIIKALVLPLLLSLLQAGGERKKEDDIWRVIEVVITSRTRNAVVLFGHVGSNPTLSVLEKALEIAGSWQRRGFQGFFNYSTGIDNFLWFFVVSYASCGDKVFIAAREIKRKVDGL